MAASEYDRVSNLLQYYLSGEYTGGLDYAQQAEQEVAGLLDHMEVQTFYLYYAVILAALYPHAGAAAQQQYVEKLAAIQEMWATWQEQQRVGCFPGYSVICAELARVTGNDIDAMQFYDQAIWEAEESGVIQETSLANERAARFYLAKGMEKLARAHLLDAHDAYQRRGIEAKAAELEAEFPQWFGKAATVSRPGRNTSLMAAMTRLTTVGSLLLDVMTIVKTSQTLSQEVYVAQLLEKIMRLVIENAGATKGLFIKHVDGAFLIQAKGEAPSTGSGGTEIETMQGIVISPSPGPSHQGRGAEHSPGPSHQGRGAEPTPAHASEVPLTLLHYVAHTHTPVILNDMTRDERYAADPYITTHRPKSLLCLPFVRQGELTGLLYLENRLMSNAFTPERVELLKVLSSQAAISMENAALYEHLEQKVSERTAELAAAKGTAEAAKDAAEAAKVRFQALSEATFEGLLIHDNGRILEVNKVMETLTGYSRAELINGNAFELLIPDSREEVRGPILARETKPCETRALKRDGTRFPVELQAREILWQDRRVRLVAVRDITWRRTLEEENLALRATLDDRDRFGELVGQSPAMRKVYDHLIRAAACDDIVIIYGETGTGKELAARTLFELSAHHTKNFVAVNCGAIQESLFEPNFFGYRKGAFTGADREKIGHFEQARGGTLFLDEIGELTLAMQAKLLRVLNDGTYMPVGATISRTADVRIIAATNRDLRKRMRAGKVREDFFHRLHVLSITLPPLRHHKEDIPLLIAHFLQRHSPPGAKIPLIPAAVRDQLMAYDWPGNVRELFNELQRYLINGELELGGSQPAPARMAEMQELPFLQDGLPLNNAVDAFERFYISRTLKRVHNEKKKAAGELQISRKTLYARLDKLGIKK